eukprot:m.41369 g.41369  ORF g.41369 m.41369 type:complete len:54 (+) comp18786_c0_seq1:1384-1545(+)
MLQLEAKSARHKARQTTITTVRISNEFEVTNIFYQLCDHVSTSAYNIMFTIIW